MSNIIGEGFDPKIIDQIKVRQKIYGSKNRNNEQQRQQQKPNNEGDKTS